MKMRMMKMIEHNLDLNAKVALFDDVIEVMKIQRDKCPFADDIPTGVLIRLFKELEKYVPSFKGRLMTW